MLLCSWGPLEFPWSPNSMPTKICLFNLWWLSSWSLLDQSFPTFSTSWQAQKVLSVLALGEERVSISAHQLGKFGSDFWSHTDLQNAALCFHNSILLGAKGSIYRIRWLGTSDCNHTAKSLSLFEPFFLWVAGGVPLVHSLEVTPTGRPRERKSRSWGSATAFSLGRAGGIRWGPCFFFSGRTSLHMGS